MIETPTIDWAGLSPLIALLGGALLVLVFGLARPRWVEGQMPPGITRGGKARANQGA